MRGRGTNPNWARSLVDASGRVFCVKGAEVEGTREENRESILKQVDAVVAHTGKARTIGALIVMESTWPKHASGRKIREAIADIAGRLMVSDHATSTARVSFELDRVEWVVSLPPGEQFCDTWARLDAQLTAIVEEACS